MSVAQNNTSGAIRHRRREADLNEVAYGHGHRGRDILWSSASPLQRYAPAQRVIKTPKRLIAKGIDSSSIAPHTGHFLQVESAVARIFPLCEGFRPRHSL